MKRTDLVIPPDHLAALRIPALAITTGALDPEWVRVPVGSWGPFRRSLQRLPLDPKSAAAVRRHNRLRPCGVAVASLGLALMITVMFVPTHPSIRLAAVAIPLLSSGISWASNRGIPRRMPYRTHLGELRIPDVPEGVAAVWVAQNPAVIATDEPAPRPHSRRFYAAWSVGLILAAFALAVTLAGDGREDFFLIWMLVPVFFVTGIVMAYKTQPPSREP